MASSILEISEIREQLFKLTREQYHEIAETLAFEKNTELLEGMVLFKMPKSSIHNFFINSIFKLLQNFIPQNSFIQTEKTIAFQNSELEPDISVVEGKLEDYVFEHPSTAILVVEVAKSSYGYDLAKLSTYAEAKVNHFWIVDLSANKLEVYTDPNGREYLSKKIYSPQEPISIFGKEISLKEIFETASKKQNKT